MTYPLCPSQRLRSLVLLAFCLSLLLPALSHAGMRLATLDAWDTSANVCRAGKKPANSQPPLLDKSCEHCATLTAPGLPLPEAESVASMAASDCPHDRPRLTSLGKHEGETQARGPPR